MYACVCVCQLSAYTYNRPAGGKVVCLPGREYGNDISHEVSGTNIWKGSFGEEAGDIVKRYFTVSSWVSCV